jgi:uncharacterized oligopeptide transporter (OPT) family protein
MAELCTSGVGVLGWTAKWGLLLGILVGMLVPLLETAYPKRAHWCPSAFGLGLGLVLYFSNSAAMFAGSLAAWIFARARHKAAEEFTVPVASGLIAGESLLGVLLAALAALGWMPLE